MPRRNNWADWQGMRGAVVVHVRVTAAEATQLHTVIGAQSLTAGQAVRLALCQEYGICRYRQHPSCALCGRSTPCPDGLPSS